MVGHWKEINREQGPKSARRDSMGAGSNLEKRRVRIGKLFERTKFAEENS